MDAAVIVGIAIFVLLLTVLVNYNELIHLRQEIRLAWGRMDEQLKHRYELVSALVPLAQTVQIFSIKMPAVISARNQAAIAINPSQLAIAETALTAATRQVLVAIETDSSLKSDPRILSIYSKLIANQKQINQACGQYNQKVETLNSTMSSFPQAITAKAIGLQLQPIFELRG